MTTENIRIEVFGNALSLETETEAFFIEDVTKDVIPMEVKAIIKELNAIIGFKEGLG